MFMYSLLMLLSLLIQSWFACLVKACLFLSIMLMFGFGLSLRPDWEILGLEMEASHRDALWVWCSLLHLFLPWCRYLEAKHGSPPSFRLITSSVLTGYVRMVCQEPAPGKWVLTWRLLLFYHSIFMAGYGLFGLCLFLVLCMVLRLLSWLRVVCSNCELLYQMLFGLVGSLWPTLVLF